MEKSETKLPEIPKQSDIEVVEQQETVQALQELFNDPSNKAKGRVKKFEKKLLENQLKYGLKGKDFTVPLNQGGNLRMHQTFSGTLYMRDKSGALHRMSEEMLEEIKQELELADSSLAPRPVGLLHTDRDNIGLPLTPNS